MLQSQATMRKARLAHDEGLLAKLSPFISIGIGAMIFLSVIALMANSTIERQKIAAEAEKTYSLNMVRAAEMYRNGMLIYKNIDPAEFDKQQEQSRMEVIEPDPNDIGMQAAEIS